MAANFADLVWADGKKIPADEFHLHPQDEGLLFGRGLFETTRTQEFDPLFWPEHLNRLTWSARISGLDIAHALLPTAEDIGREVREAIGQDVVIRLNVSAGPKGGKPRTWWFARPLPTPSLTARLMTSAFKVSRLDPYASLKSFHYGMRHHAFLEALELGFDDALLTSVDDVVLETAHANIFCETPAGWSTPALEGGVLAGIVREKLITTLGAEESMLTVAQLKDARCILITNSVRGVRYVTQIDQRQLAIYPEVQEIVLAFQRQYGFEPAGH